MHPVLIAIIAITVIISLAGFQNVSVFEKYKFNVSAIKYKKEYIRLLSAGFLHADWGHLFFNMFTLYFFGPIVLEAFMYMELPDFLLSISVQLLQGIYFHYIFIKSKVGILLLEQVVVFLGFYLQQLLMRLMKLKSILYQVLFLVYCIFLTQFI